jgi:predicted RNA-binding Zn-ribbon protein involved in translation (DUF1610 family)
MRRCTSCGKRSESENTVCRHCGEPFSAAPPSKKIGRTCTDCSADLPGGAAFCPECGVIQLASENREPGSGPARCPKCGSERFVPISLLKKLGTAMVLGPLALYRIRAKFHCDKCGHQW